MTRDSRAEEKEEENEDEEKEEEEVVVEEEEEEERERNYSFQVTDTVSHMKNIFLFSFSIHYPSSLEHLSTCRFVNLFFFFFLYFFFLFY